MKDLPDSLKLTLVKGDFLMSDNQYTYDAFISYRHTQPDKDVAERLHRMLETYKVPRSIAKLTGKKKINRVFRDRDELPTSSNLADNITNALENSRFLIVICSPRTPQSQWVLKEIETFSKLHGHDRILALLIEGEPAEAFPQQLRFVKKQVINPDGTVSEIMTEVEPLAADIRASTPRQMFKNLKTEILRLLSPILGCKYDDLKQRHRERLVKNILTASLSLSAFFLAFGSFSTYQALIINQKSQEVIKQIKRTQMTQSLYLADISRRLLEEGDRHRAILVALEALPKDLENPDRPYVHEAEFALSKALNVYDIDTYFDPDRVIDHDKPVVLMQISPDRKTLLTASRDGYLYTWNIEDGSLLGTFDLDGRFPDRENTYFLDNEHILTVDGKYNLVCLDIKGGTVWNSDIHVTKSVLSPDNQKIAFQWDNALALLDTQTGAKLSEIDFSQYLDVSGFDSYISTIKFNADSTRVALGSNTGAVLVIDLESNAITPYSTGYSQVEDIVFTPGGEVLVASNWVDLENLLGGSKGMLQRFSPTAADALDTWTYPFSSINKLTLNPGDTAQLIFVENEKINVLDYTSGDLLFTFIHGDTVTQYDISGNLIVSASYDGTIRFWLMQQSGIEASNYRITRSSSISQFARAGEAIAFFHHNQNKVYLYRMLSNPNTLRLPGHSEYVYDGTYSPDDKLVMTRSYTGGELILWDAQSKELLRSVTLEGDISEAVFTSDGSHIAVLLKTKKALLLKTEDLSIEKELVSDSLITAYPSSYRMVISDEANGYRYDVYDMETFDKLNTYETLSRDVIFLPDNRFIQYSLYDKRLSLHDGKTGDETAALEDIELETFTLSQDGALLALALKDKTLKLYNVEKGFSQVLTLSELKHPATRLIFSPDTKHLYIGLDDYSVAIYTIPDGRLTGTIEMGDALKKVIFSADGNQVMLVTLNGSQLWNIPAFKQLAAMDYIYDLDSSFQTILVAWNDETLFIPVYDTRMLLAEAEKQLNGRVLTEKERKTLFIEP